jgi:hypothetical protein
MSLHPYSHESRISELNHQLWHCARRFLISALLRRWRAPINVNRHLSRCERVSDRNAPLVHVMRARAVPQCSKSLWTALVIGKLVARTTCTACICMVHTLEKHTRGCNRHDFHYIHKTLHLPLWGQRAFIIERGWISLQLYITNSDTCTRDHNRIGQSQVEKSATSEEKETCVSHISRWPLWPCELEWSMGRGSPTRLNS